MVSSEDFPPLDVTKIDTFTNLKHNAKDANHSDVKIKDILSTRDKHKELVNGESLEESPSETGQSANIHDKLVSQKSNQPVINALRMRPKAETTSNSLEYTGGTMMRKDSPAKGPPVNAASSNNYSAQRSSINSSATTFSNDYCSQKSSINSSPKDSNVPAKNCKDIVVRSLQNAVGSLPADPEFNQHRGEDHSVNDWQKISILICAFVILREFHPIESYFVKYLETLDASYTRDVVRRSIYPVGTYSSLVLMVITFLITDYTRYKPIVLLDVLAGLLSYVLILDNPSLPVMWIQQVCIGFYHAGEVSYYSYMYSKIKNKDCYQRATGRVKATIMMGRLLSGVTGQTVVSLFRTPEATEYKILVYLSILGMAGAALWTCFLPPVEDSVYFHQATPSENSYLHPTGTRSISGVVKVIWKDFKTAFSNVEILKWSLWWVLGMGGYILVITYNQVLWSSLVNENPTSNRLMNGAVDAIFTIAGAISTISIGRVSLNWHRYGVFMLALGTLIQGLLLILTHSCHSLKMVYMFYIVFGCIHYTMLTIASSEIAKHLKRESFALVFGFNKFVALLSVSLFTLFVVQIKNTPTRTLYLLFGIYFISIGLAYTLAAVYKSVRMFITTL